MSYVTVKGTASFRGNTDIIVFIPNIFCMELIFFRITWDSLLDGALRVRWRSHVARAPQESNHFIDWNNNRSTIYTRPIQKEDSLNMVVSCLHLFCEWIFPYVVKKTLRIYSDYLQEFLLLQGLLFEGQLLPTHEFPLCLHKVENCHLWMTPVHHLEILCGVGCPQDG